MPNPIKITYPSSRKVERPVDSRTSLTIEYGRRVMVEVGNPSFIRTHYTPDRIPDSLVTSAIQHTESTLLWPNIMPDERALNVKKVLLWRIECDASQKKIFCVRCGLVNGDGKMAGLIEVTPNKPQEKASVFEEVKELPKEALPLSLLERLRVRLADWSY